MTEAVLTDAQQVQAHALDDLADSLAGIAVQLGVDIVEGAEQERQGHDVQTSVEVGVDDVGVGGQLDGAVDNALDTLGLVASGQLVSSVNLNLDLAAGGVADHLAEVTAHVSPAGVLGGGAGELPGHLGELGTGLGGLLGILSRCLGGLLFRLTAAAGDQGQAHDQREDQCKKLFHCFSSLNFYKLRSI